MKRYGQTVALGVIDLAVAAGSVFGLLGAERRGQAGTRRLTLVSARMCVAGLDSAGWACRVGGWAGRGHQAPLGRAGTGKAWPHHDRHPNPGREAGEARQR